MFLGKGRVEANKGEMGGDEANYHEKLEYRNISCASQFTSPDMEGTSPDLVGNNTKMWSSKLYQVCHTPDFSSLLLCFISIPSSSLISLSHT